MGGTEQLVRAAGVLAGVGLAFAAAAPFTGVPPRGRSGALAPAQIEVRVIATGEFTISPLGTVLKATPFPQPGERGGPTLSVTVQNITPKPMRISARLRGIAPELDEVATVRGSVAGAVVLRGALGDAGEWTEPLGLLKSGETSTLRIRFKLRPGVDPDQFAGRLDIRELQLRGTVPGQKLDVPPDTQKVVPGTVDTAPATTTRSTTPTQTVTPVATPEAATSTPQPPSAIPPRSNADPKRRAPDEGAE